MVQLHKSTRWSQFSSQCFFVYIRTHGLSSYDQAHRGIPWYLTSNHHLQYPRKCQWMILGYTNGQFLLKVTVPKSAQDNETYRRNGSASFACPSYPQRPGRSGRTSHPLQQTSYLYDCLEWQSTVWEQGSRRSLPHGCTCRQWYRCDK